MSNWFYGHPDAFDAKVNRCQKRGYFYPITVVTKRFSDDGKPLSVSTQEQQMFDWLVKCGIRHWSDYRMLKFGTWDHARDSKWVLLFKKQKHQIMFKLAFG